MPYFISATSSSSPEAQARSLSKHLNLLLNCNVVFVAGSIPRPDTLFLSKQEEFAMSIIDSAKPIATHHHINQQLLDQREKATFLMWPAVTGRRRLVSDAGPGELEKWLKNPVFGRLRIGSLESIRVLRQPASQSTIRRPSKSWWQNRNCTANRKKNSFCIDALSRVLLHDWEIIRKQLRSGCVAQNYHFSVG